MINKYRLDQLFVYLDSGDSKYKICYNRDIPSCEQLIPLCSLFLPRTTVEKDEIYKYKLSFNEISIIEKAINNLTTENLYVAPVKIENDKPATMPILLTWNGTGRDSPRRPYFQQYLSNPYVDYDRKHLIKLSNLFEIKRGNVNPLQILFLNQIIASPNFNKRFETYLNKIVAEEKEIEAAKDLIEDTGKQKDNIIANDFEKFLLW